MPSRKVINATREQNLLREISSDLPTLMNEIDEVTSELSWAERMELKPRKADDQICPVKVGRPRRQFFRGPSPL